MNQSSKRIIENKMIRKNKSITQKRMERIFQKVDVFNTKCRGVNKGKRIIFSMMIWLVLLSIPGNIYKARVYITGWEIYRNSNFTYRIGERINEEKLMNEFESMGGKEWTEFPNYILKEDRRVGECAWVNRFPYPLFSCKRITRLSTLKEEFKVYGITYGMKKEGAEEKLLEKGYKWVGEEKYKKGGVTIELRDEFDEIIGVSVTLP